MVESAPHSLPKGSFRRGRRCLRGRRRPLNFALKHLPLTEEWSGCIRATFPPLAVVKCPYCQRPVKLVNPRRRNLLKKVLPRCGACHRYVLAWPHKLTLALLALAAAFMLLKLLRLF